MRAKSVLIGVGGLLSGLALLLAFLLFTSPGLSLLGRMAQSLSGGTVRLEGLAGSSINNLRVTRVEIGDAQGVWLRVEGVSLRWSVLALLADRVTVHQMRAARVTVLRRPVPNETGGGPGPSIDVAQVNLPKIELVTAVIGQSVVLSAAGSLRYLSLRDFAGDFLVTRADNSDQYRIAGGVSGEAAQGTATIREGTDGILGRLAGLPGLGPVNLTLRADGPRGANRLLLILTAGALRAEGSGLLRLPQEEANLDLRLISGAMSPRADIGWDRLTGEAHLSGRFDAPTLAAQLLLSNGRMAGLSARTVTMSLGGDQGRARLAGAVEGLRLPGAHQAIFAATPWRVEAQVDLQAGARPVRFQLDHRLVRLEGEARTRGGLALDADLTIPSLAPFAALEQVAMDGRASLHLMLRQIGPRLTVAANGRFAPSGQSLPARLLGRNATLMLTAQMEGADILASQVRLAGSGLAADISGSLRKGDMDYRLALQLRDLSRLVAPLNGALSLNGTIRGSMGDARLVALGSASLATAGFARQQVAIQLQANGLPGVRTASLSLQGGFNDAPLEVRATLAGSGSRKADIMARWKSLTANANLALGAALSGRVHIAVTDLSDLAVFTGDAIQGSADATALLTARGKNSDADLRMTMVNLRRGQFAAENLSLQGRVADVLGAQDFDLALTAQGLKTAMLAGDAEATVRGQLNELAMTASVRLADGSGGKGQVRAEGVGDLRAGQVRLSRFDGDWKGVTVGLEASPTIRYGDVIAIDRLALRLGKGRFSGNGQIAPQMAFRASARDVALEDFRVFMPALGLQGALTADIDLSGTLAAPEGSVTLQANGLRTTFTGRAMPPGTLHAALRLSGGRTAIDASLQAGERVRLVLVGDAPLSRTQPMTLRASGQADLALLDILLAAEGRRVRGALTLDAVIAGTPANPRISGVGALKDGEFQDYARGLRIQDIAATLRADGEMLHVTQMTARAGTGSLSGTGSLNLSAPDLPLEMALRAERARPVVSDLLTATVTGNLGLVGTLNRQMTLSGALQVLEGEINLPERFPPQVAVLNVRRKGAPLPAPPPTQSRVDMNVTTQSIGPLFVRGRGIEAEMTGDIRLTGTSTLPVVNGAFRLVRGNYNLGGQRLDFTSGMVRFDGTGLRQRLDPTLDFVAQTMSGGITARLAVTGYASAPRIALSSTPTLPQDEVVAQLLFRQSTKQLSPLQLASIAQAAASLGGLSGGGFNPLGMVRRTLGLDRLTVGSVSTGEAGQSQTTVEAGSYVMRNVYLGVRQNLSGGTQTQAQVDITDRLKAQATVSVGGAALTQGNSQQDTGSSVGLSYQIEY